MNWNDLNYFVHLVREQTLTATADKLEVGHTTVARRIEHLEASLAVRLFERVGKRYHVTEAGRRLYEQALKIEADVDELNRMAVEHDALAGRVTLSVPAGLAYRHLLPKLNEFYDRYPHILLDIRGENHRSNLSKKEADIALRIGRPEQENLVIRKLGQVTYANYATASFLDHLEQDTPIRFLQFSGHQGLKSWMQTIVSYPEVMPIFNSNDLYMIEQCVRQGMGIGILPDIMLGGDEHRNGETEDGLMALPTHPLSQQLPAFGNQHFDTFYLVIHSDVRGSVKIRAVMDWVYGVFEH